MQKYKKKHDDDYIFFNAGIFLQRKKIVFAYAIYSNYIIFKLNIIFINKVIIFYIEELD